jgi:hypothetical protein
MASTTTFMGFTLPALNEFVDSWNEPVNQNFEDLDDWLDDLYNGLIAGGGSSIWSALKGSAASLSARLDVSILANGTLNVSNSPDIVDMSTSSTRGKFTNPRDRLNDGDEEIYAAGQPATDGRFVAMAQAGPTAGFPPEGLDSGIALRSADFGLGATVPISSPRKPWAPGLVTGGATPLLAAQDIGVVRIDASTRPAIFNIDGYIFRLREIFDFDWNLLSPGELDWVWIYVERIGTEYGAASGLNFKYDGVGGTPAVKDLRRLQSGTGDGITATSQFDAASGLFQTKLLGKVKEGHILVIESGTAAGNYVIDSVSSDTVLLIKGFFKADVGGANWHILDNSMPNIGAVVTDTDPMTLPPTEDGRVYIGRAQHRGADVPLNLITFTKGGVFDSGWMDADAGGDFPFEVVHNLGALPTHVDVWMRLSLTDNIYEPKVQRQVLTNFDEGDTTVDAGDAKKATLLMPSVRVHCGHKAVSFDDVVTVELLNASTDPANPAALFTDSGGTDRAVGKMRVIARL